MSWGQIKYSDYPLYTGGLFHCNKLEKSIYQLKGVGCFLSLLFYFCWKILLASNVDIMWHLIWVFTVCLWPFYGFKGKNGLKKESSHTSFGFLQTGNNIVWTVLLRMISSQKEILLPLCRWMDRCQTWDFTSFSTVFQSYHDNGQVVMKDCAMELHLQLRRFCLEQSLNLGPLDQ